MHEADTISESAVDERRVTARWSPWLTAHRRSSEAGLLVVAAVGGWLVRFSQDDAFITYRYAANLARGRGLVFNPGEKVEGYTNFLWTVIHALPEWAGWNTPLFSQLLGIATLVACVAVVLRLARLALGDEALAYLATLFTVGNLTFLAYGTGGLETMLQTLLVSGVALLTVNDASRPNQLARRLGAGVLGGLALLTRLDSALLVVGWFAVGLWSVWRARRDDRPLNAVIAAGAQYGIPFAVVVAPWLAWKLSYYGSLLPNTFYAKSASGPAVPFLFGLAYLALFFLSYGAFVLIPRFVTHRRSFFDLPATRPAFAVVGVWLLYICVVGADFMEFRFLVPVIPVLAMLVAFLVDRFTRPRRQAFVVIVLALASICHRVTPALIVPVLSFNQIDNWPKDEPTTWKGIGELLAREFPGGESAPGQPRIAVAPLGLIGYYADLPTVDMIGLTDPDIGRHGDTFRIYAPGHLRIARLTQLVDKHVDVVIGEPVMQAPTPARHAFRLSELAALWPAADLRGLLDATRFPDARVVEIPLLTGQADPAQDQSLVVLQLRGNAKFDAAVARNGWPVHEIDRNRSTTCRQGDLTVFLKLSGTRSCPSLDYSFF